MLKKINNCVSCDLPCAGQTCPYHEAFVEICDQCETEPARYRVEGHALCEYCADDYVVAAFDYLSLKEQAEALEIDFEELGG